MLAAIDADPRILDRSARPGHLTASGLVVDVDGRRFVLIRHRKLQTLDLDSVMMQAREVAQQIQQA